MSATEQQVDNTGKHYFDQGKGVPINYLRLHEILMDAFAQAAVGKGAERHGQDKPFEQQPIQLISQMVGSNAGLIYQVCKKSQESLRLSKEPAIRELHGAIVYAAAAILYLEENA